MMSQLPGQPPAAAALQARPPRRGRPGYDLESLLAVAVKLFNERGYDGTSMEDLSRKLGITKSAIYHHVPSKAELLRLAVNRALDGLFAEVDRLASVDGRAIDRLEHLVRGSVVVLAQQLPFVTLLLRVRGNTVVERERWPAAANSTISSPAWSPRRPARVTCAPTWTRRWPPGCCSAWSTRSSSGTARAAPPLRGTSPTPWSPSPSTASASAPRSRPLPRAPDPPPHLPGHRGYPPHAGPSDVQLPFPSQEWAIQCRGRQRLLASNAQSEGFKLRLPAESVLSIALSRAVVHPLR